MKTLAIYNMKGGVGKTTTAVNLSFIAAATGRRVLLWDLDPQAASSFAFRVKPRVIGFDRKSLECANTLRSAIRETDYRNLDLLPADFAYRKFDRFLNEVGTSDRVFANLLQTVGRDYDCVVLDCPAGYSLLIEGVFAAAQAILVPTIPSVLSLRTLTRLVKRANHAESQANVTAFFSMVDRRKTLHARICELSKTFPEMFLSARVPYASIVEQMAVRREPLGAFAPRDAAAVAFTEIWSEIDARLQQASAKEHHERWAQALRAIEPLIMQLQSSERSEIEAPSRRGLMDSEQTARIRPNSSRDVCIAHDFDTEGRDLLHSGYVLELREHAGHHLVVAARAGEGDQNRIAMARIDSYWTVQILSGQMSPLAALDQRLGQPAPMAVDRVRGIVGARTLRRIESRVVTNSSVEVWQPGQIAAAL